MKLIKAENISEVPYIGPVLDKTLYALGYFVKKEGDISVNGCVSPLVFPAVGRFIDYDGENLPTQYERALPNLRDAQSVRELLAQTYKELGRDVSDEEFEEILQMDLKGEKDVLDNILPVYAHNLEIVLKSFGVEVITD